MGNTNPVVGFIGLSHLGIVSAIGIASKAFTVRCFDERAELTKQLSLQQLPLYEPGLEELLKKSPRNIQFSSSPEVLITCDIIYIARDVPTSSDNHSDLTPIISALECAVKNAKKQAQIVVLSQVPPGFTRREGERLLRSHNRNDLEIIYQVETLIFGRAVERTLHPERYIIGLKDPDKLPEQFKKLLKAFDCPILPMRYESAELAKISINICLISSITTANVISELCEQIGADWGEIVPALKLDKRIGQHAYINPGLGIAGGNLERDLVTLKEGLTSAGGHLGVVRAWEEDLNYRADWVLRRLKPFLNKAVEPKIAVFGLSYKQDTNSIKNSPAVRLIKNLTGCTIQAYDPSAELVDEHLEISRKNSAYAASEEVDVVVVMTPWGEFKNLDLTAIKNTMRGSTIIDPFKALDGKAAKELGLRYITLGLA